ncbi:MAG: AraC family transcriptional regulator [Chthoniobacterales bacterium]
MKAKRRKSADKEAPMWQAVSASLRWGVRSSATTPRGYRSWMAKNAHSHSYTEVLLCVAGNHSYGVEGAARSLSPGEILIIPPGVRHDSTYSRHHAACTDIWFCFVTPEHVGIDIVQHKPGSRLVSRRIWFADSSIEHDLKRAYAMLSSSTLPATAHMGKAGIFLLFLLQEILENLATNGISEQRAEIHPIIPHIKRYIADNLSDRLSLSDLARVAGFSPFHFHREFRRVEKITPRKFIEQARLNYACDLLKRGSSVTAAALDSGYADCPQFNRSFKKYFGLAPLAWLKSKKR